MRRDPLSLSSVDPLECPPGRKGMFVFGPCLGALERDFQIVGLRAPVLLQA